MKKTLCMLCGLCLLLLFAACGQRLPMIFNRCRSPLCGKNGHGPSL